MPRESFERHLHQLQDEVLVLGSMVEKAIDRSMEALKKRDLEMAGQVVADDARINQKRFDIEAMCIELVVTQQPMASDLRIIVAVLNVIIDLERIADHAAGVASIALMIGDEPPLKPLVDLPRMAEKAGEMLRRSLDAFINRDAAAARQISAEDDEVDDLYDQVFRELLTFMAEDPRTITRATRLIWVAHNLERSADRITNICERVVFVVTGKMEEIGASKY
ncbi:MAG: phosphate signaling complex protein PhoU [Dehalococcoidia bacterium]|nr:phosphate signaling complex protein PhoU [Dehalococcoidia bacterium]